jgi:two-component system, NarL family, nitrate/nitrite response regulator NarL
LTSIAVVDDHQLFRIGVEAVLAANGIEVVASVSDGDQALAEIDRLDPDLVLLDIRMPLRDGVSTLEAMRARGDRRKVIVMATELSDHQLLAVMKAGVDAILFKHEHESQLFKAIEALQAGQRFIGGDLMDRAFSLALDAGEETPLAKLTPRERQIVDGVAKGLRNREIGNLLGMTEGTVKITLHGIFNKLKVENRTELAILALPRRD